MATGQRTGTPHKIIEEENQVFVGRAIENLNRENCTRECLEDLRCQSLTFTDAGVTRNTTQCVLNFFRTMAKIYTPSNLKIASLSRDCPLGNYCFERIQSFQKLKNKVTPCFFMHPNDSIL